MFRLRKKNKPSRSTRIPSLTHLFHGIEIIPGPRPCEAVQKLANRRMLSEEAPPLPLNSCSRADLCTCKYTHFADRRTDSRRESDIGLPSRTYLKEEKRAGSGRRITDD